MKAALLTVAMLMACGGDSDGRKKRGHGGDRPPRHCIEGQHNVGACDKHVPGPAVPEPTSFLLFGAGLLLVGGMVRRATR